MRIKTTPSVVIRIILWLVILLGGAAIGIAKDLHHFPALFTSVWFHLVTFVIGFFLMKIAFHAAAVGGRELAAHGRKGALPRLETNRLVTTGIYRCSRHPMLFGLTLIPLALALMLGSPTFILFVAPAEMVFIIVMVIVFEERECHRKFGVEYVKYADEVPLFPRNFHCIKALFFSDIQ